MQNLKTIKKYKTCPNHLYWLNEGIYIRLEKFGTIKMGTIMYHYIKDGKERGCIIVGFSLYEGFKKITKEEYEKQLCNSVVS